MAEILKHRLADFRAAKSPLDILAGNRRVLREGGRERMVVDLRDDYWIEFSANHPNNPETETGDVDWTKVGRIKILRIGGGND